MRKRQVKVIVWIFIFMISFICIDGLCARFLNTRPIISIKDKVYNEITEIGVVYKSLFADVYYCDTIMEVYNEQGYVNLEKEIKRYYQSKNSDFVCDVYISKMGSFDEEVTDLEYMKLKAEGAYKAGYQTFAYNKKLNIYAYNFVGYYAVSDEYQDIYMYDVNNFNKAPIKLELDGFDLAWRTLNGVLYSPSGNLMIFHYFCGYRSDQWMGEQKYTYEDCIKNNNDNGIYVFRVNDINDYSFIDYYSDKNNEYISEYQDSYFRIYEIIDDENIIIKYTVTNNKQEEPYMEVYYKWNIVDDTLMEWQV